MNQINFTNEQVFQEATTMHDNKKLRRLMSLPPIKHSDSTNVLLPPELPTQQVVTGDLEVDAVLWLEAVVGTGDATHIQKAMEAIKSIKTPLKELGKRYSALMMAAHPGNFLAGLRFVDFGDLNKLANHAVNKVKRQNEALSRFNSVGELYEETPAEQFCIEALHGINIKDGDWKLPQDECNKRFLNHQDMLPFTLSDCLFEISYWHELYSLRNTFGNTEHEFQVNAREYFIREYMMANIVPRNRGEALAVLEYLIQTDLSRDLREETSAILRNLVIGA